MAHQNNTPSDAPPAWPPPPSVGPLAGISRDSAARRRKKAGREHVWKGVGLSLGIVLGPFLYLWLKPASSGIVTFNPEGSVCAAVALGFTLAAWY